jgi:hypothetical protein
MSTGMSDVATDHLPADTTARNDCSTLKAALELAPDRTAGVGRLRKFDGATFGQIQSGAELRGQGANERLGTTEMSIVGSPRRTPAGYPET